MLPSVSGASHCYGHSTTRRWSEAAWHTHPNGQTIYVTEGVGLAQRRGGRIEVIRPGDRVFFEAGEDQSATESIVIGEDDAVVTDAQGQPIPGGGDSCRSCPAMAP